MQIEVHDLLWFGEDDGLRCVVVDHLMLTVKESEVLKKIFPDYNDDIDAIILLKTLKSR